MENANAYNTKRTSHYSQHIRERFGFLSSTEIDFVIENEKVILKKTKSKTPSEQITALRGSLKGQYNSEALLKLTRG